MYAARSGNFSGRLTPFFLLTFGITWGIAAFLFIFPATFKMLFGDISISNPMFVVAVAAPTLSAVIVVLAGSGWAGLKGLLARLVPVQVGLVWYVLSLFAFPAVALCAALVFGFREQVIGMNLTAVLFLMLNLLYTGPLGEELGWRGFALPRLLDRFSPFTASLLLGAVWGTWHLPSFFAAGLPQSVSTLPSFLAAALLLSIVATWLFIRSGGSVLISILLHYSVNFSLELLGLPIPAMTLVLVVFAVLVVALDRGVAWFRPQTSRTT